MESATVRRAPLIIMALAAWVMVAVNASAGVSETADLSATIDDGLAEVDSGDNLTYTIVTANVGPDDVTGASVSNTLSAGLTCTWTCSASAGSSCTASGSGEIADTVDILSGSSLTYTASCNVTAPGGDTVTNSVTITEPAAGTLTDPEPSNNTASDSTSVNTPVLEAELFVTVSNSLAQVTGGDNTTYTIVAGNSGPEDVTGATFTNSFSAGLSCAWTCSASSGSSCTASGSDEISDSVDILSGGSLTYTANCTVPDSASGSVSSAAAIAVPAGVTDSNPGNNSVADSTAVRAAHGEPIPTMGLWSLLVLSLGMLGIGFRRLTRARMA